MKTKYFAIAIILLLGFTAFFPKARAVSPPPDGCYPNFTTAEGCNALAGLGAGTANTGIGWYSLFSVGDANYNTGLGAGALALNSADSNTAVGAAALLLNTAGTENTAVGTGALVYNDSGQANTATGALALFANTMGNGNTATGYNALSSNTDGGFNTAIGNQALINNITGFHNTGIGISSLRFNTTGSDNIALGGFAGQNLTTGDNNIYIGNVGVDAESDRVRIGTVGTQMATYIAGIFTFGSPSGVPVYVNADGKLGTNPSSQRFKNEIKPMAGVSEAVYSLQPVTFRYKKDIDPAGSAQFGLVAEDVEKVNPDLVVRDKQGQPYSVRYDQVNAMLLNEFLKEHKAFLEEQRKVQKQEATIAQLKNEMATVVARLKEQDSKIERVSDQIQMSSAGAGVVVSKQ